MAIFFTADWHLGHSNILKFIPSRPWKSINEMDEALIKNCNELVKPEDTLYFLGDFALGSFFFQQRCCEALQAKNKILLLGNHDPSTARAMRMGFKEVRRAGWIEIQSYRFQLNHFPYDNQDKRFQKWLTKDEGFPLLCGHIHDNWKTRGNMLNVGCDVWDFKPVSEDQVREAFKGGS